MERMAEERGRRSWGVFGLVTHLPRVDLVLVPAGVLVAILSLAVGRGFGLVALVLVAGATFLLVADFRLPRVLAMASLLMLVPTQAIPKVPPATLVVAGEIALALGVLLLGQSRGQNGHVVWLSLAFIGLLGAAALKAQDAGDTLQSPALGFFTVSAEVLLVAVGARRRSRDGELAEFASGVLLVGLALAGWSILEFVTAHGLALPFLSGERRSVGPIGNPNYLGAMLAQIAVLAFGLARARAHKRKGYVTSTLVGLICVVGMLTTLSKGAILGLVAGVLVLIAIGVGPRLRKGILVPALIGIAIVGPFAWNAGNAERMSAVYTPEQRALAAQSEDISLRARYQATLIGVRLAAEHPLAGVGLERFPVVATREPSLGIYINTHDEPVRIAAEAGVLALALLCLVAWMIVRRIRLRDFSVRVIALPVAATYLVLSLFLNGLEFATVSFVTVVCLFLGAGSATADLRIERP